MTRLHPAHLVAVLALALHRAPAQADAIATPPGERWILSSPAACPGVDGPLPTYEHALRERVDAAMKRLGRTPRVFKTRAALLDALHRDPPRGWLFLLLSGHGKEIRGDEASQVCLGEGNGPGDWLDINHELLPAMPASLAGAVIVLDSCNSAQVDPHLAVIPSTIISASPYVIDTRAQFGAMIIDSFAAARDENCNNVFDDDDLFAGMMSRLRATLSLVAFEAWPKLRRNAPSPVPLAIPARPSSRCAALAATASAVSSRDLPPALVAQRNVQGELARGQVKLPALEHDFFVVADGSDASEASLARSVAGAAGLVEISRVTTQRLEALAATTTFADIYRLELSLGWMRVWRLRDRALVSVVRIANAACGVPSRTVLSRAELVIPETERLPEVAPRYSQARRYLRDVRNSPLEAATACFEAEGQCFLAPAKRLQQEECSP
jgi:hypothetical protein